MQFHKYVQQPIHGMHMHTMHACTCTHTLYTGNHTHIHVQDATQKTLMECFDDLLSEAELKQLTNFDDTLELDTSGTGPS